MYSILLAIIYLAFISLGLPDSLLGSAWPVMHIDIGVATSYAGIISMIIAGGTIISSLLSDRLTARFGAGLVTSMSVLLTAVALFGFSVSNSFILLCLIAIPYGLGAGAVDAALNNYVALHYSSRHMSWLHCFWGVGAAISPYIMSFCLSKGFGWQNGYFSVSVIQIVISVILFASLSLWKKRTANNKESEKRKPLGVIGALKIKGVIYILLSFLGYGALETTAGLWASSYLVEYRNISTETAALFASLFYLGITFGRFLSGFVADKFGDKTMIRLGIVICLFGIILVAMPINIQAFALVGLLIIGFGCAPIYPAIIHSTPSNFGEENSQAIIGIQMASAYVGTTFIPPLFGALTNVISIGFYPVYLFVFAILMLVMSESLNKKLSK